AVEIGCISGPNEATDASIPLGQSGLALALLVPRLGGIVAALEAVFDEAGIRTDDLGEVLVVLRENHASGQLLDHLAPDKGGDVVAVELIGTDQQNLYPGRGAVIVDSVKLVEQVLDIVRDMNWLKPVRDDIRSIDPAQRVGDHGVGAALQHLC